MYSVPAVLCRRSCDGIGKMAIPFAGYPLYLADEDRQAQDKRVQQYRREWAAQGGGCENTILGCGDGIVDVLAWVPTILQVTGGIIFVVGLVQSQSEPSPAPRPNATWAPDIRASQGATTFGVVGTF